MLRTTKELADAYGGKVCTLNGRPATISGRLAPWAVIRTLSPGLYAEFSWPAVARVMETGGEFHV